MEGLLSIMVLAVPVIALLLLVTLPDRGPGWVSRARTRGERVRRTVSNASWINIATGPFWMMLVCPFGYFWAGSADDIRPLLLFGAGAGTLLGGIAVRYSLRGQVRTWDLVVPLVLTAFCGTVPCAVVLKVQLTDPSAPGIALTAGLALAPAWCVLAILRIRAARGDPTLTFPGPST